VSLVTAVATASVFAIFGFPFRNYQCWYSWSWLGTNLGLVLYLTLAGGGGGLLGWSIAGLGEAHPSGNLAINGVFYGVAGSLALRAGFTPAKRGSPPRTRSRGHATDTVSALGSGISWTTELLNDVAKRRAQKWFKTLSTNALASQAMGEIIADIESRPLDQMTTATKKKLLERLIDSADKVSAAATPLIRAQARAQIVAFCADYCIGHYVAKPSLNTVDEQQTPTTTT
jgi:hypothetical protein